MVHGRRAVRGGNGNQSKTDNNGFTLYFSDRRNNRNTASLETGEYGWEDFVNPLSATGTPNGALDGGEDVNQNNALETYGGVPNYNGVYNSVPPGALAPLVTASRPTTALTRGEAQVNRAILFRHALKLVNGSALARDRHHRPERCFREPGVRPGRLERGGGSFAGAHSATAVMADAVTLLSNTGPTSRRSRSRTRSAIATAAHRPGIAWRSFPERASPSRSRPEPRPTSAPTAARTTSCVTSRTATRRELSRVDGDVLTSTGRRPAPSSAATRFTARRSKLRVRHGFPEPGAAAAEHADVPRPERGRLSQECGRAGNAAQVTWRPGKSSFVAAGSGY